MRSAEYDLKYIEAAVDQLEDYLLSDVLYWPISVRPPAGSPSYPQLTLGGLLLSRVRASVIADTEHEKIEYEQLNRDIHQVRTKWTVYWGKKSAREFQARLNLWQNYLDDYRQDPNSQFDRFAYEIGRRVQLELLSNETNSINSSAVDHLNQLDLKLKTLLISGEFIWDNKLEPGFPPDTYWYLFGLLPSSIEVKYA